MNKLAVLALLFGVAISAKIPIKKRSLKMGDILNFKDRIAHTAYNKFVGQNSQEVPMIDYSNT